MLGWENDGQLSILICGFLRIPYVSPFTCLKTILILSGIIGSHYPASFLASCLYQNITVLTGAKTPSLSLYHSHYALPSCQMQSPRSFLTLSLLGIIHVLAGWWGRDVCSIRRTCISLRPTPSSLVCTHGSDLCRAKTTELGWRQAGLSLDCSSERETSVERWWSPGSNSLEEKRAKKRRSQTNSLTHANIVLPGTSPSWIQARLLALSS